MRLPVDLYVNSEKYPPLLKEIHSPPKVLHINGTLLDCDRFAIAIVGSRNATLYGLQVAGQIGYELAQKGITIVSGLARGIDAASHRGALRASGRTIAVLGSGLDKIYPKENIELAEAISKQGCVMSEFPSGTEAFPQNFPIRNRIISGLSLGVIIIEASRRSGSLITAAHAVEQGREVFAVPGQVSSLLSEGSHSLIKQGAKLIESAEDVLEELAPVFKDMLPRVKDLHESSESSLRDEVSSPLASDLIELLTDGPLGLEEIIETLGNGDSEIQEVLIKLETSGKIRRLFGAIYELV